MTTVTGDIPAQETETVSHLPHLTGLDLADPTFHLPGKVDILLGSEVYPQLMTQVPLVTGTSSEPAAIQMIFGWAIIGPVKSAGSHSQQISTQCSQTITTNEDLDTLLSFFWTSQEPERPILSISQVENQVQLHYAETVSYCPTKCRYQVSLPWKPDAPPLGDSRSQALSRYISNERSILRRNVWKAFQEVVQSYLDLGHAELVPKDESEPACKYYLPMHGVFKQSSTSTKLRVVFDGSAVTTSGSSLNQSLMVGPTLHPTLETIILKFRLYPIAITADVSKMYREVELSVPDRDFHRFLWRSTPDGVILEYRMTRVTFGVSASPYLAVRTLQQTAEDHGQGQPEAAQHIRSSFYVDDLLAGASSVEAALQLQSELRDILKKGGFHLCKWRSSSPSVMEKIPPELHEKLLIKEVTDSQATNHPKALGLEWNSATDCMSPSIKKPEANAQTKRGIVSNVARTFDILGWISPSVLVMKLLYQQLWKLSIGWDEPVPENITAIHSLWKEQLPLLAKRQLPRCYFRVDSQPLTQELHCFCDASQKACGAVIYLRSTYSDHPPMVSLVMSKTRVAKLPQEGKPANTIPRQELCGALLLTQVLLPVKAALNILDQNIYCWTDSSIVLSWLDSQPKNYKPYVSNRISSILQVTSSARWKHVPTSQNPADCASRGMMPKDLLNHDLWWSGPSWLFAEPIPVPKQPPRRPVYSPENKVSCNVLQLAPPPFLASRYSSYHRMLSITAWCLRFIHKLKIHHSSSVITGGRRLSAGELSQAEVRLARLSQGRFFSKELHSLLLGQAVAPSSRLISLAPFVDDNQLLRVGGRLKKSSLAYSQSYPIILSSKDIFTKVMFNHFHECLGHCGPSLLLCHTGKRFHILGARKLSRTVCSQCTICRRATPLPQKQYMGDLPLERVNFTPPFTVTGLDFAGPFTIKMGYTRRPVKLDAHICIFVCFTTKAVHIEVISELTTKALLLGLHRFCDRRVCPKTIYSDNGSNFRGAQSYLRTLYQFL